MTTSPKRTLARADEQRHQTNRYAPRSGGFRKQRALAAADCGALGRSLQSIDDWRASISITPFTASDILAVLDQCDASSRFPVLDNGYVYLAANRLSLHRSASHWAMVIEIFGFSPRAGVPNLCVYTFANQLRDRNAPQQYVSTKAYQQYVANNPHNEAHFFYPIDECDWQDAENSELLAENSTEIVLRGERFLLPLWSEYAQHSIELEMPPRVYIFELLGLTQQYSVY